MLTSQTERAERAGPTPANLMRFDAGEPEIATDWVATEEPLEIRIRGRSVAVVMRTPGDDAELACGFLLSEGLIKHPSDLTGLAPCQTAAEGNVLNVFLAPHVEFDFERLTRHTFASSSCGLCGKASIESVHQHFAPVSGRWTVNPQTIAELPAALRASQKTFAMTGGLHAAGIFSARGKLLAVREDVGRHNAVDKVIGWAFLRRRIPLSRHILFVSGRTSFEVVQKALAAGIQVVAAVSAPSSLAVEFARESNQTLLGFVRGQTFNVYSAPDRIKQRRKKARRAAKVQ